MMKAPTERINTTWPTEKLVTSHLPMASLRANMKSPTSMSRTPARTRLLFGRARACLNVMSAESGGLRGPDRAYLGLELCHCED